MTHRAWTLGLIVALALSAPLATAGEWSAPAKVRFGRTPVVEYRGKIESGYLVIEAKHAEGWHTYTMDNIERAREASGKENPETELPTRIEIGGRDIARDTWWQSEPKDLTMLDIKWYTWGFEDVAYFAVPLESTSGESLDVTIHGQACNASSCAMVDAVALSIPVSSETAPPPPASPEGLADTTFVQVRPERASPEE